jgi:hypothetical protein
MQPSDTTARVQELEARVDELTALVRTPEAASACPPAPTDAAPRASRRHVLKLAGAAAVGATAAALAREGSAAALDGDAVTVGETRSTTPTEDGSTVVVYTNPAAPTVPGATLGSTAPANLFLVRDEPAVAGTVDPSASAHAAAVAGYSYRTVPNGVYGLSRTTGAGVVGEAGGGASSGVHGVASSGAGLRARSESGPTVQLEPVLAEMPATGTWARGAVVADTAGRLWYNTTGGTPGTWVNLAQSYRAVTPFRVYDSREPLPLPGRIATGQSRTISVRDRRAILGGVVVLADAVPAGTLAVTANVTVVDTVLSGYLTVNPGGDTAINSATVNWSATDQILNNGVNVTINPATREITVIAGGISGSSTTS